VGGVPLRCGSEEACSLVERGRRKRSNKVYTSRGRQKKLREGWRSSRLTRAKASDRHQERATKLQMREGGTAETDMESSVLEKTTRLGLGFFRLWYHDKLEKANLCILSHQTITSIYKSVERKIRKLYTFIYNIPHAYIEENKKTIHVQIQCNTCIYTCLLTI